MILIGQGLLVQIIVRVDQLDQLQLYQEILNEDKHQYLRLGAFQLNFLLFFLSDFFDLMNKKKTINNRLSTADGGVVPESSATNERTNRNEEQSNSEVYKTTFSFFYIFYFNGGGFLFIYFVPKLLIKIGVLVGIQSFGDFIFC